MESPFDWLSLMLFAGLIVLLLQRSTMDNPPDKLWQYGPPAVLCAGSNYLGNEGYTVAAIGGIVLVVVYILYVLRPKVLR